VCPVVVAACPVDLCMKLVYVARGPSPRGFFRVLERFSSLMRANSIASRRVLGLNIRTAETMSDFSPPRNAPTSAF
jgi:hypothetical protein